MRELLPGILSWPWFSERHGYDFSGTFVLHPDGNLCIDPVEAGPEVFDRLAKEGVARILLTNRNHGRAANRVRERTGATLAIHPADAAYAREQGVRIDLELHEGERVGPFEIVGVPGKSPGEVALFDAGRRLLLVGDAVIGHPPGRLSVLPERVLDDPLQLWASLRQLLRLDFDCVLVGDGVPLLTGGHDRLAELVAGFPRD